MEEEGPRKSIFAKNSGGSSTFYKGKGSGYSKGGNKHNGRNYYADLTNNSKIADGVKKYGADGLLDDFQPPNPFKKREKHDAFDMHDFNAPLDTVIDDLSWELDQTSIQIRKAPTSVSEMESIVDDGGVLKRIHKKGLDSSDSPGKLVSASDGCRVWIHYNMFIDPGSSKQLVLLDSTKKHGLATSLVVGEDGILGLYFAIKSMKKKEIAEFSIEPQYGYGKMGIPGFVEGNQRLRLVVILEEISAKSRKPIFFMDGMEKLSADISFSDVLLDVEQLIQAAKLKFEKKMYKDASDRYNWAVEIIKDFYKESPQEDDACNNDPEVEITKSHITPEEEQTLDMNCFQLYSNLALCYGKLENYEEVVNVCESALALDTHCPDVEPKVLHRYANALYKLGRNEKALKICKRGFKSVWGQEEFKNLECHINATIKGKEMPTDEEEQGNGQCEAQELVMEVESGTSVPKVTSSVSDGKLSTRLNQLFGWFG